MNLFRSQPLRNGADVLNKMLLDLTHLLPLSSVHLAQRSKRSVQDLVQLVVDRNGTGRQIPLPDSHPLAPNVKRTAVRVHLMLGRYTPPTQYPEPAHQCTRRLHAVDSHDAHFRTSTHRTLNMRPSRPRHVPSAQSHSCRCAIRHVGSGHSRDPALLHTLNGLVEAGFTPHRLPAGANSTPSASTHAGRQPQPRSERP